MSVARGVRVGLLTCVLAAGCSSAHTGQAGTPSSRPSTASSSAVIRVGPAPISPSRVRHIRPSHVVVVVEENHAAAGVLGRSDAPYLNSLVASGMSLTNFFAITHPSEPNYLALLSGSTQHLTDDSCPHRYSTPSLVGQLRAAGLTFAGYAEGLPQTGFTGCTAGRYVRRHAPWTNFADAPAAISRPLTALPRDFAQLPTVSFVIPNLDHDMHDGTVAQADTWLRQNLGAYARWARSHNSLLIVTWDEDDHNAKNHIPTIISGAGVRTGRNDVHGDLYRLLRTLEWFYNLVPLGEAAQHTPITTIWTR
jgi:phosphatidylinositol-3-phosphatase